MAPFQRRKPKSIRRARHATISVKVVRTNGKSTINKIPLLLNRRNKPNDVDVSHETDTNDELDYGGPGGLTDEDLDRSGHRFDLDNVQKDVEKPLRDQTSTVSQYMFKKIREESGWENARNKLHTSFIAQQYIAEGSPCCACGDHGRCPANEAVCRCCDCGWEQVLCLECATMLHNKRNVFHVLEIWKDGTFVPLFPNTSVLTPPGHKECGDFHSIRNVVFLDLQGRQHLKKVQFCRCQSDAEALVSMGFWPGTLERPGIAFDLKLLDLFSQLLYECHCSLDKLCSVISLWKHPLLPVYVHHIYQILNSCSFDEYRFFKDSLGIQFDECVLCPMPGGDGPLIEIMDACFGFVRKKSAGTSISHPKFETRMFADQNDVDNFVLQHSKELKKSENPCNQYKAGEITDSIRSKGQNAKYDEKAVLGRICRHGHPKGFISLKHGERIAYAIYELKRMVDPYRNSPGVQLKCMYDIACILETHLQRNKDYGLEDVLNKIKFGIPIFHAFVHKAKCQVQYSPRRVAGLGLTDGEGIERLWSYLRKFSYMTKEMKANRRTDILSEALLHYARRMLNNQGKAIVRSLKRTKELKRKTNLDLEQVIDANSDAGKHRIDHELVSQWMEEELQIVSRKSKASQDKQNGWPAEYAVLLWNHFLLRNTLASSGLLENDDHSKTIIANVKCAAEKLKAFEKRRNISKRWKIDDPKFIEAMRTAECTHNESFLEQLHSIAVERHMQIMLKEKYSHGQKQAIRLSRKITKYTNRMKTAISKHNARLSALKEHIPLSVKQVSFDEAKDIKSSIYGKLSSFLLSETTDIPFEVKKKIIDMKELQKRCAEEEELLEIECKRLLGYKTAMIQEMKGKVEMLQAKGDSFSFGLSSLFMSHCMALTKKIFEEKGAYDKFEIPIPISLVEPNAEYMDKVWFDRRFDPSFDDSGESSSESESEPEYFDNDIE